jgi:alkyldihydroxyacetonephosphate synthase
MARGHGGVHAGRGLGERWKKQPLPQRLPAQQRLGAGLCDRHRRNGARLAARDAGHAGGRRKPPRAPWPRTGERVHAYTHLSHLYAQGASVYTTFVWRLAGDYDADLARWRRLKTAVSDAIVASGGTISHQHGVGTDHAPWLDAEKGELGMDAMRALFRQFDPDGCMNPGKLVAP